MDEPTDDERASPNNLWSKGVGIRTHVFDYEEADRVSNELYQVRSDAAIARTSDVLALLIQDGLVGSFCRRRRRR